MSSSAVSICRLARERGLVSRWDGAPELGLVLVTGPDSVTFLQDRLTSDVKALAPGQGQLSAKLTGRGELVGYFSLHRLPDLGQPFPSFFLLAPGADLGFLRDDLASTLIGEEVLLEDVSTQFEAVLVQGPGAVPFVDRVVGPALPKEIPDYSLQVPECSRAGDGDAGRPTDLLVLSRSFTGDPGRLLLWNAGSSGGDFAGWLLGAAQKEGLALLDTKPDSLTAWRWLTVEAGWPAGGRDMEPGKVVLPRTGLEHQVVSSTKGCFPGQEVVARIRTYGSVPTALRGLVFSEGELSLLPDLPRPGNDLSIAGKKIGSWGTAAWSVTLDRCVALAFIDRNHRTPGTLLEVETGGGPTTGEVVLLPFFRAGDVLGKARHLHEHAIHMFSGGRDEEAVVLLEEALRLDPGLQDAYEALGVILGRTERYIQAIEIFRRLEEVAPDEPMVHTNLSLFYMKIGDKEEAERQQAQATLKRFAGASDPVEAEALEKAAAAARRDEARRKIEMFSAVLEIDPEDSLALMGMGNALVDLQEYAQASGYLMNALRLQGDNSAVYAAYGKVLESLDKPDDAADVYRRGVVVASRRGDLMPLKDMEHRLLMLGV